MGPGPFLSPPPLSREERAPIETGWNQTRPLRFIVKESIHCTKNETYRKTIEVENQTTSSSSSISWEPRRDLATIFHRTLDSEDFEIDLFLGYLSFLLFAILFLSHSNTPTPTPTHPRTLTNSLFSSFIFLHNSNSPDNVFALYRSLTLVQTNFFEVSLYL